MPIYAFECEECQHYLEDFIRHIIKDEEKIRICPKCGKTMNLVPFTFHWKDSVKGRYLQDQKWSTDNPNYNFNLKKRKENEKKI
jgi:putative FmdB family regulatory protein